MHLGIVRIPLGSQYKQLITKNFDLGSDNIRSLSRWVSDTFIIRLHMTRQGSIKFRPARLVIPSPDSFDQRVNIRYDAYSVPDKRIRTFKVYVINNYRNHPNFKEIADELCKQINFRLTHGAIFDPEHVAAQKILTPEIAQHRIETEPTIFSALDLALTTKLNFKENTYKSYHKVIIKFKEYLKSQNRANELCRDFKYVDAVNYSVFMMQGMGLSARTHNNHINGLKTLWFDLKEMEIVTDNPWIKVRKPSSGKGRNIAFNVEQQKELMQFMREKYPEIGFLCRFIYYTGCRTVEVANLTIGDLFQAGYDKIHIDRKWAKSSNMRQVVVHPKLEEELLAMDLKRFPPEYYLFSRGLKPGKKKLTNEQVPSRFRLRVLTPLGYGKEYTLYSWRHTFAVMGYMGGMTIAELGMQLGHQDPASTTAYLKSLGLFENDAVKKKLPGLEF